MDQEVTRVKVVSSGASTPQPAVRGDVTRMSLSSNRSEFWDKETMVPLKGGHVGNNLDSETNVTLSGASNLSGNSTNKVVEANGEAIKDKDDSGLSSNKSEAGGAQPDATSNASDGVRTSLLNKEAAS